MNDHVARRAAGAMASLILGLLGFLCLGLLAGVPAVILGHRALSQLKKDQLLGGKGMAIAGLVLGYMGIAWSLLIIASMALGHFGSSIAPFLYTLF